MSNFANDSKNERIEATNVLILYVLISIKEIIKDAPGYQEKVTHLNEFSGNLVTDPCLGEEERRGVREETVICNENWNDLVNLANAKQAR